MTDRLRLLLFVCLFGLVSACTTAPESPLGELPRTPQATTQELLQQAQTAAPAEARLLRLTAAEQSYQQGNPQQARSILETIETDSLPPAQQVFANTLQAELAMQAGEPELALQAVLHPSFEILHELPADQQLRSHLIRADAFEANGQTMPALRERVFVAPLLSGQPARDNHQAIWPLVSALPAEELQPTGDPDLDGWLALAASIGQAPTVRQQQAAIDGWLERHPGHPAARELPEALVRLREMTDEPITRVALLLPMQGQLASVAEALRDGFLSAHLQAQQTGEALSHIELYDSSHFASLDALYRQAEADRVQLVIGPLDKDQVRQLGSRDQLPINTLALNYSDAGQQVPPQLFQFGLAAEDEAREAARRAWVDGHRSAIALTPRGDWGSRVLQAFRNAWLEQGGELIAAEPLAEPIALANQIAELLQLREGEAGRRVTGSDGATITAQPVRRQDIDFLFLAASPQQAQQVKPTLAFQYAADLPVYSTSHLHAANNDRNQYLDLEGIRFAETPWLLDPEQRLRQQVEQQWPQAGGSLGRLYAMGADAYLLASRLNQLLAFPDMRIEGHSGTLSLGAHQRIERALPWAEFRDGNVVPLGDSPAR
ncbi:penicillin-binding protein activator [Stutzerimonas tarimensis]|uniref:Penicillin-binding protein activator n=1 Tax=Stutzerimonas tarimensis TaxID=1507735 RepID=A0ABV7T2N9_9GAMM